MDTKTTAYLQLALAMVLVGGSVVASKLVVASFPVFLASELRFLLGCLILTPLLLKTEGFKPIGQKDGLVLFLQALAGVFLFSILLLYGLKFTSAVAGGIITSTTPAIIGLISVLFLKERLTLNTGAGIAFSFVGILTINLLESSLDAAFGSAPLLGNLLILGAVIGEALFVIFPKVLSHQVSALATATWVNGLGLVMFLPFALYEAGTFDFAAVDPIAWLPIFYNGILLTVVAFLLWFQGMTKVPASTAAVFTSLMPLSALLFSYFVLNEPLSWAHGVGVLCVLLGLGFIAWIDEFGEMSQDERSLTRDLHEA